MNFSYANNAGAEHKTGMAKGETFLLETKGKNFPHHPKSQNPK
jgi:hypothetical protein